MEKLYYLVTWGKDKQKAWSGTCWGLFNALKQHCGGMTDVNLNDSRMEDLYFRFVRKIRHTGGDLELSHIKRQRHRVRRLLGNNKCSVFQFAEVIPDTENIKTYIYLDLSVDYVWYMSENMPDVFAVSNFNTCQSDAIRARNESQLAYFRNCSGIFTMGRWLAKDLVERSGIPENKVHPVGGGINLDGRLVDYTGKQGNKILFVGRDFVRKGGDITLEAFFELRKKMADAELYVAGPASDPWPQGAEGYHYMGDCSHEELSILFNKCDIFVMPSHFEAYGLVFIEALTYGLPCIGRNAYEMPYFIEDGKTGLLLRHDDVHELSEMMYRLLKDRSVSANVRSRKDIYLREYSWNAVAKRILDVVE